jgi:hypothetical protein
MMATWKHRIIGIVGHIVLLLVNFSVLVGIIESLQLFFDVAYPLPILNYLLLGYMAVHTFMMLCVQLGIQLLELIKVRSPTVLILYYFKFSDEESIPIALLDPTKSRLAVLVLLLVISGGPILYPIFAAYGFLTIWGNLSIITLDPGAIIQLFAQFLNWVPPLLGIAALVIVISIVMIEFRHV